MSSWSPFQGRRPCCRGGQGGRAPDGGRNLRLVFAEAEAGRILGRRRRAIKASTLVMDRSRIESHVKPLLGKRQVGSLKLGDIEGAQADIAAGKTSKARVGSRGGATTGGEGVAARTMSTLHAIFEHAVRLGQIETNPARGVRRLASAPRSANSAGSKSSAG